MTATWGYAAIALAVALATVWTLRAALADDLYELDN